MTIDHDTIAALDEKLASQIGDDIQVIFNHEYLFKEARLTIRNLYDDVKRLRADLRHVIDERDATFALMLARAEKAEAERDALRAALVEHNDLLRSASQIAKREGIDGEIASTNWDAYYNRVAMVLKRHHEIANTARQALKGQTND